MKHEKGKALIIKLRIHEEDSLKNANTKEISQRMQFVFQYDD